MKKIAFVELDTHAEIAGNFLTLMSNSYQFEVDYFFSPKIEKFIAKSSENIILTTPKTLLSELRKKEFDLVIVGTVHRNFNLYLEITKYFNTAIIVHNLNFTRITQPKLIESIFKEDFIYRLKLLFKEGLLSVPQVYQNAKNLLVLDQSLVDDEHQFLPLFYAQKYEENVKSSTITIVIPGAVDQKRRNYLHVLNKITEFRGRYRIVFLGKAAGQELPWLKNFQKQNLQNLEIVYFEEKVPQKEFDQWMKNTDLLWCPVQPETVFFNQKEIYGKTKMSGNIGDAIKYVKPAIFPINYLANYPFVFAEEENIELQIQEILNSDKISFQQFEEEKVLQKLEQTLLKLI